MLDFILGTDGVDEFLEAKGLRTRGTGKTLPLNTKVLPLQKNVLNSSGSIRYPSAVPLGATTDYVAFKFYDYKPPFQAASTKQGTGVGDNYNQYNASVETDNLTAAKDFKPIFMYMPQDIQGQYGANWGGASFGAAFQQLARTMANGGVPNASSFDNTIDAMISGGKNLQYKATVDALNKGLGSSVSLSQLMSGVSGTIINPNVEMMYESPELRGFQLRFRMQARNQGESQSIRELCYQFKKAMLASYGGQTMGGKLDAGGFITVPKICQVSFMTGGALNEYVPQYKPCAITQVDINFTPDGAWASTFDGAPVATELAITFKETKIIYAQELTSGGASY